MLRNLQVPQKRRRLGVGEKKPECCGTCKYHKKEDDWVCDNPDSDCYTDYTEYSDFCENFEKRTR